MKNPWRYFSVLVLLLIVIISLLIVMILSSNSEDIKCLLNNKYHFQHQKTFESEKRCKKARRILSEIGSIPPLCTSKCGKCTPCKPVHIPVPPGTPVTAEYYPEAWRCKCGNRLYIP